MKALYLLVFFFLSTGVFSQYNDIKGKVKSIREEVVYLEKESNKIKNADGSIEYLIPRNPYGEFGIYYPRVHENKFRKTWIEGPYSSYINYKKEFNTKGLLINETWYYPNNSTVCRWEYAYNENDSLIQNKRFSGKTENFITKNINYDYKDRKKTEFRIDSSNPNKGYLLIYEYDANNNISKESRYQFETGYESSTLYFYTSKNKITDVKTYIPIVYQKQMDGSFSTKTDSIGTVYPRKKILYDVAGNSKEIIHYSDFNPESKNAVTHKLKLKYDDFNNLIEEHLVTNDTFQESRIYSYNDNNQIIKHIYKSKFNSNHDFEANYKYDNNLLIRIDYKIKEQSNIITFQHQYDKKGNWIKQLKFVNGKPKLKLKRKIKYYD